MGQDRTQSGFRNNDIENVRRTPQQHEPIEKGTRQQNQHGDNTDDSDVQEIRKYRVGSAGPDEGGQQR